MTRADDLSISPTRRSLEAGRLLGLTTSWFVVEGDVIREIGPSRSPVLPCLPLRQRPEAPWRTLQDHPFIRFFLWPYRTMLWLRVEIGGHPERELGMSSGTNGNRFQAAREIWAALFPSPFAFRRHAQPLRAGSWWQVFNQSAPIIKLPADATEDDHLASAWSAQQFDGLLLDQADVPDQGQQRHGAWDL